VRVFFIRVPKASVLSPRRRKAAYFLPTGAADPLHDHLRQAVAPPDDNRLPPQVYRYDLNFAAVIRIDRPGAINERQALSEGQTAAGTDLRLKSPRQSDGDPRRHQRPFERRQDQVRLHIGIEVHARGSFSHVLRQGKRIPTLADALNLDLDFFHLLSGGLKQNRWAIKADRAVSALPASDFSQTPEDTQ
jgi:hypothetical protein